MSFVKRKINLTIGLGEGPFGTMAGQTQTIEGLRVSCTVQAYGGETAGQMTARVYGLPLSLINQLTTVGIIAAGIKAKNTVLIEAGDEGGALSTVYKGAILTAFGQFNSAPAVAFNISASASALASIVPVAPTSYQGGADVGDICEALALVMGLSFENHGVAVQLSNPYFYGSALAQLQACMRAAGARYSIDRGVLAIWPRGGGLSDAPVMISKETGMVGYPDFSSNGLLVTSRYQPAVKLGGKIQVQSTLTPANGIWKVNRVIHDLEAEMPDGKWFTSMECTPSVG